MESGLSCVYKNPGISTNHKPSQIPGFHPSWYPQYQWHQCHQFHTYGRRRTFNWTTKINPTQVRVNCTFEWQLESSSFSSPCCLCSSEVGLGEQSLQNQFIYAEIYYIGVYDKGCGMSVLDGHLTVWGFPSIFLSVHIAQTSEKLDPESQSPPQAPTQVWASFTFQCPSFLPQTQSHCHAAGAGFSEEHHHWSSLVKFFFLRSSQVIKRGKCIIKSIQATWS